MADHAKKAPTGSSREHDVILVPSKSSLRTSPISALNAQSEVLSSQPSGGALPDGKDSVSGVSTKMGKMNIAGKPQTSGGDPSNKKSGANSGSNKSPPKPFLGAHISLLSNANFRYEGILFAINPEEETVTLKDVRFFGTEGRNEKVGKKETSSKPGIYPILTFEGKNIQDLTVKAPNPQPAPNSAALDDPAIRNAAQAMPPQQYPSPYPGMPPYGYPYPGYPPYGSHPPGVQTDPWGRPLPPNPNGGPNGAPPNPKPKPPSNSASRGKKAEKESSKYKPRGPRHQPGTGGFLSSRHNALPKDDVTNEVDDFDFASSSAKYDKQGFAKELEKKKKATKKGEKGDEEAPNDEGEGEDEQDEDDFEIPVVPKKYDKKISFFDNLSSNTQSKPIDDDPTDVETFGKAAENYRSQHRRYRRRGGRRGGRRSGRGRGGGNDYNNSGYNSNNRRRRTGANHSNWRVKTSSTD